MQIQVPKPGYTQLNLSNLKLYLFEIRMSDFLSICKEDLLNNKFLAEEFVAEGSKEITTQIGAVLRLLAGCVQPSAIEVGQKKIIPNIPQFQDPDF